MQFSLNIVYIIRIFTVMIAYNPLKAFTVHMTVRLVMCANV